jgi:dephospho-CoA kinase
LKRKKPLKIGLTGGMGAGKSLVLSILKEKGVPVLQTDIIGHQLLREKMFSSVLLRRFGKDILGKNGKIDRKKMALAVFGDPHKQKALNELVHPVIRGRVSDWIRKQALHSPPAPLVVVEVPLLFERGYYKRFDFNLSVSAPKALREKRLKKRGWNLSEIRRREGFQWSQTRKNKMADQVIFNLGSLKDLKYEVCRWYEKMKKI